MMMIDIFFCVFCDDGWHFLFFSSDYYFFPLIEPLTPLFRKKSLTIKIMPRSAIKKPASSIKMPKLETRGKPKSKQNEEKTRAARQAEIKSKEAKRAREAKQSKKTKRQEEEDYSSDDNSTTPKSISYDRNHDSTVENDPIEEKLAASLLIQPFISPKKKTLSDLEKMNKDIIKVIIYHWFLLKNQILDQTQTIYVCQTYLMDMESAVNFFATICENNNKNLIKESIMDLLYQRTLCFSKVFGLSLSGSI